MMPPAIPRLQKLEKLARYAFASVCNTLEISAIPESRAEPRWTAAVKITRSS